MNPVDLFDATWKLFRTLAVEATIVIAFAAALHALTKSAYWRRTIWQVATLGLAALVLSEATGVTRGLTAWAGTRVQAMRAVAFPRLAGEEHLLSPALSSAGSGGEGVRRAGEEAPGFMLPTQAKKPQGVAFNPTLTRPPATLSHSMGEGWGEGTSPFTSPQQANKVVLLTLPSAPPPLWWLGPFWMLGTVAVLARVALGRCLLCLFCRRRRGHADPALIRCVEALARRMGIRRRVRVIASAGLSGPIAFGTCRPTIGLPENSNFNPAQQEAMLAHELAHLAAHDPFWHLLADAVSAVLWWQPLVWWLRHQLHAASESAADEASLLLHDGPGVLAECLVALGTRLPQRASLGWMRIEGNGFRSGLGRRVERLLQLDGRAWRPRARLHAWLAKTMGPALLVAVGVVATAWTQSGEVAGERSIRGAVENSWRHSLASSALYAVLGTGDAAVAKPASATNTAPGAPARIPEAAAPGDSLNAPANPPNAADTTHLNPVVTDGVVLYQLGKFDEAEAKFQKALKQETNNPTAAYYLTLIEGARQANEPRRELGTNRNTPQNPASSVSANSVPSGPGREKISRKLDRIVFEKVSFEKLPLIEVAKFLKEESRERDPDKEGVNFMVASHPDNTVAQRSQVPVIDPRTGVPTAPTELLDLKDAVVQLPTLDHVRLADVVDAICKAADKPIKYSIEEYAVVFSLRTAEPVKLYTRTYKVDPNTFLQALQKFKDQNSGAGQTGQTNNLPLREFFSTFGVDLRTNAVDFKAVGQQRAVYFNDRTGVLFVRATMMDLDIIDQALQALNIAPPQVVIEAKFVEIREADSKALGFDWFPANSTDQAGQNVPGALRRQQTNAAVATGTITGILTDPQFRAAIKTLEQRSGVDILSAPKVTTLSGREAQVATLETRTVVTSVDTKGVRDAEAQLTKEEAKLAELRTRYTEKHPAVVEQKATIEKLKDEFQQRVTYKTTPMGFGPTVAVLPYVSADGYSIRMEVTGTVKEFLGYDDPRTVKIPELSKQYQEPLPRYRTREVRGSAIVWDGQTVVLGGATFEDVLKSKDKVPVLGDIPLMGRLFRHESKSTVKKLLVIFITPTIVDPAGNRVHADAGLPYDPNTVPQALRR